MANLLNALPQTQANNNAISPLDSKNPAKADAKELKQLFDKELSANVDAEQTNAAIAEFAKKVEKEQSEMTAENTAVLTQAPKVLDLSKATQLQGSGVKDVDAKAAGIKANDAKVVALAGAKGIPVQNQLAAKNAIPAATMTAIKNGELTAKQSAAATNPQINQALNTELTSAMAGQDLLNLSGEFDVESLDVKNSDSKVALPKEASSKLSTADFLNLREISQNPAKMNAMKNVQPALTDPAKLAPLPALGGGVVMGMKPTQKQKAENGKEELTAAMAGLTPAHGDKQIFGKVMDATVTQTHGQKPVLSNESMNQIGNQVNILGQAKQDGEIKIRLRPDHLGELQMSVKTQGQNVSVQIKAENNEAKKIIEDSLGALREHLSQQNLSLAKIDVVTQPTMSSGADQTQMQFDSNQNFNQSSANADRQNAQDGSQQSRREFYREEPAFGTAQPTSMIRPRNTDSSRLDMIA